MSFFIILKVCSFVFMKLTMTKIGYEAAVERLRKAQPTHPLLKDMQAAHTRFTELFVVQALDKLTPSSAPKPKLTPSVVKPIEPQQTVKDDYADDLAQRMNHLIGAKRSMSNQFFDIQKDAKKCKELSVKILTYEADIEDLRDQLSYYRQHNKPRPDPDGGVDAFNIPSTKFEIDKKLRSIRTMICQVQDEIEAAALSGDTKRIQEREKRLLTLKNQRDVAEQKLQQATV
jgi:hypothetical protein